jgi:hypothetical protein
MPVPYIPDWFIHSISGCCPALEHPSVWSFRSITPSITIKASSPALPLTIMAETLQLQMRHGTLAISSRLLQLQFSQDQFICPMFIP